MNISNTPIFSAPFRFFFLGGIFWSLIVMINWILYNQGYIFIQIHTPPLYWHGHEMLFGVTCSILTGFLFTASSNWTNTNYISEKKLSLMFFPWLISRVLSLTPWLKAYLIFDFIFFLFFTIFLFQILFKAKNKRNYIFVFLNFMLFLVNLSSHIGFILNKKLLIMIGLHLALNLILIYITIVTGRVIPFFTKKVIPNSPLKSFKWLDHLCTLSLFSILLISTKGPTSSYLLAATILASLIHLTRWLFWKPWTTFKIPILATLNISYFWMILGLFFMGARNLLDLPSGVALHAQTVGAIGGFIFSMITRVSLGHTGRKITSNRNIRLIYLFIHTGAFVRVFGPIFSMEYYEKYIFTSGIFWIISAILFLIEFFPKLTKPSLKTT